MYLDGWIFFFFCIDIKIKVIHSLPNNLALLNHFLTWCQKQTVNCPPQVQMPFPESVPPACWCVLFFSFKKNCYSAVASAMSWRFDFLGKFSGNQELSSLLPKIFPPFPPTLCIFLRLTCHNTFHLSVVCLLYCTSPTSLQGVYRWFSGLYFNERSKGCGSCSEAVTGYWSGSDGHTEN